MDKLEISVAIFTIIGIALLVFLSLGWTHTTVDAIVVDKFVIGNVPCVTLSDHNVYFVTDLSVYSELKIGNQYTLNIGISPLDVNKYRNIDSIQYK